MVQTYPLTVRIFLFSLTPEEIIKTEKQSIDQAIETIRNRLDQFGLAEPVVARQGEEKILVQLAGIKTQEGRTKSKRTYLSCS